MLHRVLTPTSSVLPLTSPLESTTDTTDSTRPPSPLHAPPLPPRHPGLCRRRPVAVAASITAFYRRLVSPRSRSPASARSFRILATLTGWPGSSGLYLPVSTSTRTRVCSRRRRSSRSTADSSKNSISCSSRTFFRPTTTPNCSLSGSKRTTLRPRSCGVGRWGQSASIASGGSSRCHGRSGTAKRRRIASRSGRGRR